MTAFQKISLLTGALAIAAFGAASAQTPEPITVIGAINTPAHMQPVTDGRDDAVPEMPVVYDNQRQSTPAPAQPASARSADANQTTPSASVGGADLNQAVKSH